MRSPADCSRNFKNKRPFRKRKKGGKKKEGTNTRRPQLRVIYVLNTLAEGRRIQCTDGRETVRGGGCNVLEQRKSSASSERNSLYASVSFSLFFFRFWTHASLSCGPERDL